MKIGRKKHLEAEVFTSSMNDIMFFLMLFFLIISTLANPNVIKVLLPRADSTDTYSKQDVTLTITADKQYILEKETVAFEELEQALVNATAKSEEKIIVLRADATLTIQDLVDVLQMGAKNKVRMVMSTSKAGI
ncbi:MAG: biopolymer transporter ExbD [Fimbriimonadaceae bacterium]|nr:biopolymer transporter ExbD [Chitinophagales bacterium]